MTKSHEDSASRLSTNLGSVSIRPSDMRQPTCAEVDFTLIYKVSPSGKALGTKRHAACHRAHCKRCQTPEAKTQRMFERRGHWDRESAQDRATDQLNATGCTRYLSYARDPDKLRK